MTIFARCMCFIWWHDISLWLGELIAFHGVVKWVVMSKVVGESISRGKVVFFQNVHPESIFPVITHHTAACNIYSLKWISILYFESQPELIMRRKQHLPDGLFQHNTFSSPTAVIIHLSHVVHLPPHTISQYVPYLLLKVQHMSIFPAFALLFVFITFSPFSFFLHVHLFYR